MGRMIVRAIGFSALAGVSMLCLAAPGYAQNTGEAEVATTAEDTEGTIIVTARRREESLQDVPVSINAVTPEDIAELNLRDFEDLESVVPGLSLVDEGFGAGASIRGVSFDIAVSGNNPTVEFYMNDTPVTAGVVMQQMFDVGQIEVLRGPQGTLRGRASPSGAIAVTTRKPHLYDIGGYITMTANEFGTMNVNGGVGVPIIDGVLAVRVAGLYSVSDGNRVRSIVTGKQSFNEAISGRISAIFRPADWLQLEGVYQRQETTNFNYTMVESANIFDPTEPASPVLITADDRLSIQGRPSEARQTFDTFTWRAQLSALGQNLIYAGNHRRQTYVSQGNADNANFFPTLDFGQFTNSRSTDHAHEIRLQNEERVMGLFDYVIGYFRQDNDPPTDLISETAIRLFSLNGPVIINQTPIQRIGPSKERSFFGNLTVHPTPGLEISGGLRYIKLEGESQLLINGVNRLSDDAGYKEDKLIWAASANYSFNNDDAMVYASVGKSFRPGATVIGDFSEQKSALQNSFTSLQPESSTSYEIGFKSQWFDRRLRFNIAAFYQDFENYPYRGGNVYYRNWTDIDSGPGVNLVDSVGSFDFIAGVPLTVKGVEAELTYQITPSWDVSVNATYSLSKINNGLVPCDDLNGDGQPDFLTAQPTLQEIRNAYGSDYLGACQLSQRGSPLAPFSANVRTSYRHDFNPFLQGFVRALYSFTGNSQGDPQDANDDTDALGILNLYAGLRDPEGMWEATVFAKNIFDETRITRGSTLVSTSYRVAAAGPASGSYTATAPYRTAGVTAGREVGVTFRFAFGSR
jgi:iron complex outermembrane recepter protein